MEIISPIVTLLIAVFFIYAILRKHEYVPLATVLFLLYIVVGIYVKIYLGGF